LCTILDGIVEPEVGPVVDAAPYESGGGENALDDEAAMNHDEYRLQIEGQMAFNALWIR
jgi:hypothetical protein